MTGMLYDLQDFLIVIVFSVNELFYPIKINIKKQKNNYYVIS
jgi:hypothetical protein